MDAPLPIKMDLNDVMTNKPKETDDDNISQIHTLNKKDYELKYENIVYNLEIQIDSKYIYFKLIENKEDDIVPTYYKNKFDLKTITNKLKLIPDVYDDLNKIISLLNDSYTANKIKLSIKDNNINIIVTIIFGNIEVDCPINLIETKTEIDDKFEIIIKDIKQLKKNFKNSDNNKILEIEKMVKDMQILTNKKLEENEIKIKELSIKFEKSENNVKMLQNELFEIKKILKNLNKSNCVQDNNFKINKKNYELSDRYNTEENNEKKNMIQIFNDNKSEQIDIKNYLTNNNCDENENLEINTLIANQNNIQDSNNQNKNFDMKEKQNFKIKMMKRTITNPQLKSTPYENNVNPQKKENEEKEFSKEFECIDLNDKDNISERRNDSFHSEISNDSVDISSNFSSKVIYRRNNPNYHSDVWVMNHSSRKLPCICESPYAPIPPCINIPKIRIFKGFPKIHKNHGK